MLGMGSKTIVGLDVGSSSIKAVELRKTRAGIEVAHMGLEPIAPDIVVDSMIVDSGTVSSAIAKLFADTQIKSKSVATAVSGHSVIVFADAEIELVRNNHFGVAGRFLRCFLAQTHGGRCRTPVYAF